MQKETKYKLMFKSMGSRGTVFEGTFKQVWKHLLKESGDQPISAIDKIFEIRRS
jgi:hypothetical protein